MLLGASLLGQASGSKGILEKGNGVDLSLRSRSLALLRAGLEPKESASRISSGPSSPARSSLTK